MYLFESWKESFLFLKPKNLKLLGLVTLRTLRDSYRFFIPAILLYILFDSNLWGLFGITIPVFDTIQKILLVNMLFIFVLIARPSVKRKSRDYFLDYIFYFVIWLCVTLLLYQVFDMVIFPLEIFFLLFFLDSRLGIKNFFLCILRAIKMFLFNLPFIIVIFILPYYFVFTYISKFPVLFKYINIILLLGYICLFTNFYVKRLHDQFRIYFEV